LGEGEGEEEGGEMRRALILVMSVLWSAVVVYGYASLIVEEDLYHFLTKPDPVWTAQDQAALDKEFAEVDKEIAKQDAEDERLNKEFEKELFPNSDAKKAAK
jgi:hypothetical protein